MGAGSSTKKEEENTKVLLPKKLIGLKINKIVKYGKSDNEDENTLVFSFSDVYEESNFKCCSGSNNTVNGERDFSTDILLNKIIKNAYFEEDTWISIPYVYTVLVLSDFTVVKIEGKLIKLKSDNIL